MSDAEIPLNHGGEEGPANRLGKRVTINQVVAYNLTYFRKAVGLTQEEMGRRLGDWSAASVSAAERSWDGRRIRKFDADEIVAIADALGIPVVALLLPPPAGEGAEYTFIAEPAWMTADDLVQQVITDYQGETPAMAAFMDRLMKIGGSRFMGAVRSEAERILVLARDQAQQLIGESGDAAQEIERDAQERRQQAMQPLVQQVEELQRRIDDLRAFEREYRIRLIEDLETRLRDLKAAATEDATEFPPIGVWPDPTLPAPRAEDGEP